MATWTHGTAGRVTAADFVHDRDFADIYEAINRRRLLVYLAEDGFAVIRTRDDPPWGLTGGTVRNTSKLYITADTDCDVELYRCKRDIDFSDDPPTWNEYDPSGGLAWQTPGCGGANDRALIGSLTLAAGIENCLTGSAVAAALQAMIDGAEENFLARRSDHGPETISITSRLTIDFDLTVPPN